MAEPLKTFFSSALVRRLAKDITRVEPNFSSRAFIKAAGAGLSELELLARGQHIAVALAKNLPPDYPSAIDILLRSLGPEHATDELVGVGMAPFFYLPHVLFVAERGREHFDLSMHAQYELTKRFSAEGSIRPYIAKEPERTLSVLREWASDPNAHVRRLVSEGTRLRLPWAIASGAQFVPLAAVRKGLRNARSFLTRMCRNGLFSRAQGVLQWPHATYLALCRLPCKTS